MSGPAVLRHWLRGVWRQRALRSGLLLTLLVLLVALAGPWLAPHGAADFTGPVYGAPAQGAPLGYDYLGRDVWSRLLLGGWSMVWMTIAAAIIALLAGALLGLLAAHAGGRIDRALVWCADVLLAFPNLILVLLVVSMLGRAPWLIVLTTSIAFLPGMLRLARSLALGVASQEFVEAAELLGYSRRHILLREVLPNILTPLLVHFGSMMSWAVTILSGLSFLGYGVAPPAADWGLMINENRAGLQAQPWAVLAPVLMIVLFALGANLLADGLARLNARIEQR
ncbi:MULTISPECIES: ABC transporter permease [unclassified Duganella]|uniref:ABC transporter permease n=1 Tax=unclassified Duganella TaxID=2636909 RepID=UPI000883F869|nr:MULTISPECIES: ABC transporter permease [unclassified Duganella]SDF43001.1 peptide/nickel transport system permease protein [Duganella sp. OV458]SDI83549.1 peptide/nickel transport system permease protein [Duganella sp. OV510]